MKSSAHTSAIAIFGVALPFFVVLILLGGTLYGRNKLQSEHNSKQAIYNKHREAKAAVMELDAFLTRENRREKVAYWNEKLELDFIQSLSENLERILSDFDTSALRQTALTQAKGLSQIASKVDNPHSRIQLSFEGGFKPMQILLAELEKEMPHLFLESVSIKPTLASNESEQGFLSFTLTYMCWEKPKS
ncbi:MAG: GspMb/PilO family protein [Verrucomicrobiales bacterium]|nr:GspMb/PilO family protein [Verrucomicrobiales bacterium]